MKKKELIFAVAVLLLSAVLWIAMQLIQKQNEYGAIRITVNGEEYGVYSLSDPQTISIGNTNICEISDGTACMIDADCPDHLCMKQSPIDERGGSIICLPNQVVIEGIPSDSVSRDGLAIDGIS